jgi:hypothetical protein
MEQLSSFNVLPLETAQVIRSTRGATYTWNPAPSIFVTRVEGFVASDGLAAIELGARRAAQAGVKVTSYHDWWEITDYVPETRTRMTTLRRELDHLTAGSNILLRSKIVAFGVRAASSMVRNVTVFTDRASFENTLRAALRRSSVPPR